MDNHNTDEQELASARQTLSQSEAARLRDQETKLVLLPAYGVSSAFRALYSNNEKLRRLCFESPWLAAVWSAKFLILGWLGGVSWLLIMPHQFGWVGVAVASISLVIILVIIAKFEKREKAQREKLIEDMSLLQQVLGEDPLSWNTPLLNSKEELEGFLDRTIAHEAQQTANAHEGAVRATAQVKKLGVRFGMKFPRTQKLLKTGE